MYIGFLGSHLIMLREHPLRINLDYGYGASFVFLAFVAHLGGRHGGVPRRFGLSGGGRSSRGSPRRRRGRAPVGGLVFALAAALIARETFAPYLEGLARARAGGARRGRRAVRRSFRIADQARRGDQRHVRDDPGTRRRSRPVRQFTFHAPRSYITSSRSWFSIEADIRRAMKR